MTTTRISRLGAVAAGATLLTLALGAPAASAAGTPGAGTATPADYSYGFNKVLDTDPAREGLEGVFTHTVTVEGGDEVLVFCVDASAPYEDTPGVVYTATTWAASGISGLSKASDIAENAEGRGTLLTGLGSETNDLNGEYVARQLAIWNYTNPSLDTSTVANAAIKDRAAELKALAQDETERPSSTVVTVTASQEGTKNTVKVHLATGEGAALADQYVKLTGTGIDQTVQTDAKGDAVLVVDATAEVVKVDATWTGVLPAGTVLVPATAGGQEVITAEDANITRTASADLAALPVVEQPPAPPVEEPAPPAPPAEEPAPQAPVAPEKAEPKKELPYTGTWLTAPMIAGAAALVGAGTWLRRRYSAADAE